jgi:cobalt/nickel transport system permease protein
MLSPAGTTRGPLHAVPAWCKLLVAVALVVAVAGLPMRLAPWLAAPAALLIVLALISRIGLARLAWRLLKVEPFALGVAGLAVFQPDGWRIAAILVARSTLCLAAMVLLSATTPFAEILVVLRAVKTPRLLVTTLALMYRYLFLLIDEAHRMRRARLSRTFGGSRRGTWRVLAGVIGHLFVRSSERADRVYNAMAARGGGGGP